MNHYKQKIRVLAFAIFILFINILILHKTFSGLERENTIDPGGTDIVDGGNLPSDLHSKDKYAVFESRLRKLTEISVAETLFRSNMFQLYNEINGNNNLLNCDDIIRMTEKRFIAAGWTKSVYRADFKNVSYAIKTVYSEGKDMALCLENGHSPEVCYKEAATKIVKEFSLLQKLSHPNLIKVLGFCIHGGRIGEGVSMVTELGEPVELIRLLQMSWEERLKISYDVTKLLHFMAHNDFGSIAVNDFRRQQFVLVNNDIKLSDADDFGFGDPSCKTDSDCSIIFTTANFSQRLPCLNSRCTGFNEKRNIFNGGRHFTKFLLPHGAPTQLLPLINRVVDGYSNLKLNTRQLLELMEEIVITYSNGTYLERTKMEASYKKIERHDISNEFDYICRFSLTGSGCMVTVFDTKEAEDMCNDDKNCKAFVVSDQRSWTGRRVVHLKSEVGLPIPDSENTIYLKPD